MEGNTDADTDTEDIPSTYLTFQKPRYQGVGRIPHAIR